MTTTAPTKPEPVTMSSHDRCDYGKCGARAYVRVFFKAVVGHELAFCKHHFEDNEQTFRAQALDIIDERFTLSEERAGL
jgi:hypothetical protein